MNQPRMTQQELEDELDAVSARLAAKPPDAADEETLRDLAYAEMLGTTLVANYAPDIFYGEAGPPASPPARRTIHWTREKDGVTVRQGGEEDLPAVAALIDQVRNPEVRAYLHQAAEEWWVLDRAALVLVYEGSELRAARAIRLRRGTEASSIFLGPADDPESPCMRIGIDLTKEWLREAGYTSVNSWVPEARLPKLLPLLTYAGGQVVGRKVYPRGAFVEYRIDV